MTNIKPFFHIKNFQDGISDAIVKGVFDTSPRSPEYKEGYDFGVQLTLVSQTISRNAEYIEFLAVGIVLLEKEIKIMKDSISKIYERAK